MKKAKLKKEKAYCQCAVIGNLPDLKCSDIQIPNRITKLNALYKFLIFFRGDFFFSLK